MEMARLYVTQATNSITAGRAPPHINGKSRSIIIIAT
jgi:hypothetical protein